MSKINSSLDITKREIRNWKTIRVLIPFLVLNYCMYCLHSCGRFEISSAPAAPGVSKPVPSQCPVSDVRAVVVRESAVVNRQPASAARTTTHLQRQPSTEHNTSARHQQCLHNSAGSSLRPCDFHLRQPQSG